jgi:hypothetical protein
MSSGAAIIPCWEEMFTIRPRASPRGSWLTALLHGPPAAEEHALEVDREHVVPLLFCRLEKRLANADSGVVYHDVEAAIPGHRFADNAIDVRPPQDVRLVTGLYRPPRRLPGASGCHPRGGSSSYPR